MEIIRQNKLIAAVLGGLILVSALVLLFNDDSSGPSTPASDRPAPSGTPSGAQPTTEAARFSGPNFEQFDCRPLLDFDDIDAALGTTKWLTVSAGEACTHRHIDDAELYVSIQPGHPSDLIDGGTLEGVPGQAVAGVGDAAAWFTEAGTLSVAAQGDFGVLVFRVTLSRADLDEPARLQAAQALARAALPRFRGIDAPDAPPPDAPVITIEHEPPDQADQSYVTNLRAREAAGDWTYIEGLIATLRLFAGEATNSQVTPARSIDDRSALGILRLTDEYLEANPTGDDAEELARLRQLVAAPPLPPPGDLSSAPSDAPSSADASPTATSSRLSDGSGAAPTTTSSTALSSTTPRSTATSAIHQTADDCFVPYPDAAPACFLQSPVDADKFGNKYTLWFPDIEFGESWEGWVRGDSPVQGAVAASATTLETLAGKMPNIEVWLTPNPSSDVHFDPGATASALGTCQVTLGRAAQDLLARGVPLLEQAIASVMARCYIFENFGKGEWATVRSWESGLAWYLSDVVFKNASAEVEVLNVPNALGSEELGTTLLERGTTNMAFFEYLGFGYGTERTVELGGIIAAGGYGAVPDIDRDLHGFAQTLTDGTIFDLAAPHSYGPPASQVPIDGPLTLALFTQAFGTERVRLSVPAGQYACIEYPDLGNLDLRVSWRPGSPGDGSSSADWSTDLPASIDGVATFLITTIEPDGQFEFRVTDLADNPDCEDEDEGTDSTPPPPCGFCDPTSFWYDLGAWFGALLSGA